MIILITNSLSKTRLGILIGLTLFEEVSERVIKKYLMNNIKCINHNGIEMRFSVPNRLNHFRVETFSYKEPETINWIESFSKGSILWDIGANVGLYTIYAAKARDSIVYAFEPSVFNLELLARNSFLNQVQKQVIIMPIALNDVMGENKMLITDTEWGGAFSTFGRNLNWEGKNINSEFEFQTFGISMDQAFELLRIPMPDYVKIDVDGLEHFILKNGQQVLSQVKGILIEINDNFQEQSETCKQLLLKAGLTLAEKKHSDMFDGTKYSSLYNQIWERP